MPYNFEWSVLDEASKNDYAHEENSDGQLVTGKYRTLLPDGRVQFVSYKADDYGYVAEVDYQGEAKYPVVTYQKVVEPAPVPPPVAELEPAYPEDVYPSASEEKPTYSKSAPVEPDTSGSEPSPIYSRRETVDSVPSGSVPTVTYARNANRAYDLDLANSDEAASPKVYARPETKEEPTRTHGR